MGYINFSRSERSQQAIDNLEMPVSLVTKDVVKKVIRLALSEDYELISNEAAEVLRNTPVSLIKKYIKDRCIASSWHHTSNRYNETDH